MAGVDPFAAIAAATATTADAALAAVAAAEEAITDATLSLGASIDLVQQTVSVGQQLQAVVMPPQAGLDFVEIAGMPVRAQLPPGIYPGETLTLAVTAIAGTRIFVQATGVAGPPARPLPPPSAAVPETPAQAPPPQNAAPQTIPSPQSPAEQEPVTISITLPPATAAEAARTALQSVARRLSEVEARIAARVGTRPPEAPPAAPPAAKSVPPPAAAAPPPVKAAPLAPPVVARAADPASAAVRAQAPAVASAPRSIGELLKQLRLPDTAITRTAAAIASQAPARLPAVLQRLQSALPAAMNDARAATLRTIAAFERIDPSNEESLPAQISAYVSHVLDGVESKIVRLTTAYAHPAAAGAAHAGEIAHAAVAERSAALQHDLKETILTLLRDPAAPRTPQLTQALNDALITLTGAQINALSANVQQPGTITLALPVFLYEGAPPAQVRIGREGSSRGTKLDADNFHVAFVLDTANLGTVAIDLQSVGRTVKVDVKTDRAAAAAPFSDGLAALRARLETLRYRVASASASPAPSVKAETVASHPEPSLCHPEPSLCHPEVSKDPERSEGRLDIHV